MKDKIKEFYEEVISPPKQMQLSPESWPEEWIRIFWKTYPRLPQIPLFNTELNLNKSLQSALLEKESVRDYNMSITFEELSALLKYSAGLSGKGTPEQPKRTYPSAGARYPLETYIFSSQIEGLNKGVYHYNVKQNSLEALLLGNVDNDIETILQVQNEGVFKGLSALIILTSVISRTQAKYGISAYPFSLLECGHIGQNMYLISENLKLGCCAIGSFNVKHVIDILDLTDEELPLYGMVIGKLFPTECK